MESFSRGIFKNCKNTRSIYIYEELHNDHELTVKVGMTICGPGPGFLKPKPKPTSLKQSLGPSKACPTWTGRSWARPRRALGGPGPGSGQAWAF